MSDDTMADTISQDVADYLAKRLRDAFPHLKTESLNKLLETSSSLIISTIKAEQSNMAASKLRSNLLKPPAELRNTIYEIALDLPAHKQLEITRSYRPNLSMPALLAVSRQVRSETSSLLWGSATIAIHVVALFQPPLYEPRFFLSDLVKERLCRLGRTQLGLVRRVRLMLIGAGEKVQIENSRLKILETIDLEAFGFMVGKTEVQIEVAKDSGQELDGADKKWRVRRTGWSWKRSMRRTRLTQ
ncbi:hypothetical protein CLAFUW4_08971 [Fulvia fulva]|nr:hypothetical protein CLAFUR4_08977 [Fulvia fulva]KAK4614849.1 hypothetical protein CLAFUR0_08969 [Fulvia fulva]WPV20286.1 hypothetical protein CLAFUW4_08971 [Fulvia fulva]WPV35225.1 hypothetical protein CLAFUW7_08972 [Fulvia fulva]